MVYNCIIHLITYFVFFLALCGFFYLAEFFGLEGLLGLLDWFCFRGFLGAFTIGIGILIVRDELLSFWLIVTYPSL